MSLFKKQRVTTNPQQLQQIKAWTYDILALSTDIPISISQLQCHEQGCPPIETVIAVMGQPPQTFKIHAAAVDLNYDTVAEALAGRSPH